MPQARFLISTRIVPIHFFQHGDPLFRTTLPGFTEPTVFQNPRDCKTNQLPANETASRWIRCIGANYLSSLEKRLSRLSYLPSTYRSRLSIRAKVAAVQRMSLRHMAKSQKLSFFNPTRRVSSNLDHQLPIHSSFRS